MVSVRISRETACWREEGFMLRTVAPTWRGSHGGGRRHGVRSPAPSLGAARSGRGGGGERRGADLHERQRLERAGELEHPADGGRSLDEVDAAAARRGLAML